MSLKEFFYKISFLYSFISVRFLMRIANKKVILPFYHYVDNGNNKLVNNLYKAKSKKQFITDIHFFKKNFKSLKINDLINAQPKENSFLLSFDDGLSNFYKVVVPILQENNLTAVNFVNTAFLANKDLFYRYKVNILLNTLKKNNLTEDTKKTIVSILGLKNYNLKNVCSKLLKFTIKDLNSIEELGNILGVSFKEFSQNNMPYLSITQIRELQKKGFQIGAHSKNHPRYSLLDLENQLQETLESVKEIKTIFNTENKVFAFPFSDDGVSKEFFNSMEKENVITFGSSGLKDENLKHHYQRIPMEYNTIYSAETIVKGELVYYILKKLLGFNKTKRFSIIL